MSSQTALMVMTFSLILGQLVICSVVWRFCAWVIVSRKLNPKDMVYPLMCLAVSFVVVLLHLDAWMLDQLEVVYSVERRSWARYVGLPIMLGCLWAGLKTRSSWSLVAIIAGLVMSFAVWTGVAVLVLPLGWWSPLIQLGAAFWVIVLSNRMRRPASEWVRNAGFVGGYHGLLFVFYIQVMSESPADWPHALALVDAVYSRLFYLLLL